jgi:hypothetical protein
VTNDSASWSIDVTIPIAAWEVVGSTHPKVEWPKLKVDVNQAELNLKMGYGPAEQIAEQRQNQIVDLKGRRLKRDEALSRLSEKTPVLISVSGQMPDSFYLQCTKSDTLIVILGIPHLPAPHLLPHPAKAASATDSGSNKQ